VCTVVGVTFFPTSFILTGNQVSTITLVAPFTQPFVPLITTTISNNIVTIPASTVQTFATLPPAVTVSQPVQTVKPPVVTFTGGASKSGLGALAVIAAVAALL